MTLYFKISKPALSVFFAALSLTAITSCNQAPDLSEYSQQDPEYAVTARKQIDQVLNLQKQAWNDGDIEGFMQGYWNSPDLRFASGDRVSTGWQTTFDAYTARYPDKATMGLLDFTDIDIEILCPKTALVTGRWKLTRDNDAPSGLFTLHMENIDGHWKIVSDHTSSAG